MYFQPLNFEVNIAGREIKRATARQDVPVGPGCFGVGGCQGYRGLISWSINGTPNSIIFEIFPDWCVGTFFPFPDICNNNPNWFSYFSDGYGLTTNQFQWRFFHENNHPAIGVWLGDPPRPRCSWTKDDFTLNLGPTWEMPWNASSKRLIAGIQGGPSWIPLQDWDQILLWILIIYGWYAVNIKHA